MFLDSAATAGVVATGGAERVPARHGAITTFVAVPTVFSAVTGPAAIVVIHVVV